MRGVEGVMINDGDDVYISDASSLCMYFRLLGVGVNGDNWS